MRNFEELNFYEILEISIDASPFKIKRAYKNALEVYGKNSLLTYSLFSEEERVNILGRIEDAYNTLIDKSKRTAYDASLGDKSTPTQTF
jgi:DnaJ-class molecular chaperone